MTGKYALVIGNSEYQDARLAQLSAPGRDADDLARILRDRDYCAFDDVRVLLNEPEPVVREAVDEFFDERTPDDLLLLYFSGHGVRDEQGMLYLAVKNTNRSRLRSTAIKSDFIHEAMEQSRARRQVLILDCCNSGAFQQGTKAAAGGSLGIGSAFGGTGRVILTASDSLQYAWQGDAVLGNTQNSLFTHFLVEGLKGEAENDGDGVITVDELYDYAYEQVRRATPNQTPSKFSSKQEGEIVLRQITQLEQIKAAPLPDALVDSLDNPIASVRLGAVQELARLLTGRNLALARSAREALERLSAEDDSYSVRKAATDTLEPVRQAEEQAKKREEEERLAAERAEAERIAAQKAEEERIAAEKAEAERLAAQKAEEQRLAAERQEAQRLAALKAEEQRLAAAKRRAERLAAKKAEEARLAAEKAEAERIVAEKAEEERLAREEAERQRLAEVKAQEEQATRLRWEKAEAEKERLKREEEQRQEAIRKRFDDLETQISGWKAERQPELKPAPLPDGAPAVANMGVDTLVPARANRRITRVGGGAALFSIVVVILLIGSWGKNKAQEQAATATYWANFFNTAYVEGTRTAQADAHAQATLTLQAQYAMTQSAQATSQAAVDATSTVDAANATAAARAIAATTREAVGRYAMSEFARAQQVYGPVDGKLEHDATDGVIAAYFSGVRLTNLIADATFVNPYPTSTGPWDYGFTFREKYGDNQYRIIVTSRNRWGLENWAGGDPGNELQGGALTNIDLGAAGSNRIQVIVDGVGGKLIVNGDFIANLYLGDRMNAGDVGIVTGFHNGDEITGRSTEYKEFTVWKLP